MLEEHALYDLLDDPELLVVESVGGLQLELQPPEENLLQCLGACQAGGSVIDWVIRSEGCRSGTRWSCCVEACRRARCGRRRR